MSVFIKNIYVHFKTPKTQNTGMRLLSLFEATREPVHKAIDPALMTFQEYRDMADPDHKSHPSSAYQSTVERLNSYGDVDNFSELVNTIKKHGLVFEVRRSTRDMHDGKYTKTDENGDIVYGPDGMAMMMSREDVAAMFPDEMQYRHEYAVIEKDTNLIVGVTQDEWGTLLVMVADEYQKFGFGTLLVKMARDDRPDRQSGGFTQAGYNNFRRVWSTMVREYMASGFYSHLVKQGHITAEKAKEIMQSVDPKKVHQEKNYNTSDPRDWLLMTDSQSYALLYDKKIYDFDDPDDMDEQRWIDRHIIGFVNIASMGGHTAPWINMTHGPDKVQGFLMSVLLWQEVGNPIRMEPDEAALVNAYLGDGVLQQVPKEQPGDHDAYFVTQSDDTWRHMARIEQQYRNQHDQYDEWFTRILTWAESLGKV